MTPATKRRRQSADPLERYDTPAWMVRALINEAPQLLTYYGPDVFFEPCAGNGAIMRVFKTAGRRMIGADIEPRNTTVRKIDTLNGRPWPSDVRGRPVVTNPPFSRGADVFRAAIDNRAPLIALLLRLNWLEPVDDRADIPAPHRLIILPRIGGHWFTGKSTDSITVAWHIWSYGVGDAIVQPPITRVRRAVARHFIDEKGATR